MTYMLNAEKGLRSFLLLAICVLLFTYCSSETVPEDPVIEGKITVDPTLDASGDYSGIELLIAFQQPDGERGDTLFYSVTDTSGFYSGTADIDDRGIYPVIISRNDNRIGIVRLVLAHGDTVQLNSELPDIEETTEIQSAENDVYETYERLERNFNRVAGYISVRGMSRDSVETEVLKWSDLFWGLYQEHGDTYAGERAAATAISILEGWDNERMIARTDTLISRNNRLPDYLRNQLTRYYAEREGLERSLQFINQLETRLPADEDKLSLRRDRITLLYDSARTDQARQHLEEFRRIYTTNNMAMEWAGRMNYDIENLVPGKTFPEFSFLSFEGDSISSESYQDPYIIEFTRLDAPLYLEQYDRMAAIYQIYRNIDLQVITVPLSASETVMDAFFAERGRQWAFAEPESVNTDEIIDRYNLERLPTRFLVDSEGVLIQRYVGTEFDRVVQGLQKIIAQQQTEDES